MDLHEFLKNECPPEGGCMVVETVWRDRTRYLLCERHTISNGSDMFTINDRLFYDFNFVWEEGSKWKVIYKNVK